MVAYWLEFGLSFVDGGNSAIAWRFPIAFQIIPLLVLLGAVWFFPESPRWLINMDRLDEGLQVLARINGSTTDDPSVQIQYREIVDTLTYEKTQGKKRIRDVPTGHSDDEGQTPKKVRS